MSWEPICHYDDIPDNAGLAALVDGHQVALFKVRGELYAIDNFDPISKANVLSRGIVCSVQDEVCVASPLYKQHFSLTTGQCLEDETVSVNCFPVRHSGETVDIDKRSLALCAA